MTGGGPGWGDACARDGKGGKGGGIVVCIALKCAVCIGERKGCRRGMHCGLHCALWHCGLQYVHCVVHLPLHLRSASIDQGAGWSAHQSGGTEYFLQPNEFEHRFRTV